jgi:hypothetical protein
MQVLFHTKVVQLQIKKWNDKRIKLGKFKQSDRALLLGPIFKEFKEKLMSIWMGPDIIEKCHCNGLIKIKTRDEGIPLLVNGFTLKIYNKPLKKEEFTNIVKTQNLNVIDSGDSLNPYKH